MSLLNCSAKVPKVIELELATKCVTRAIESFRKYPFEHRSKQTQSTQIESPIELSMLANGEICRHLIVVFEKQSSISYLNKIQNNTNLKRLWTIRLWCRRRSKLRRKSSRENHSLKSIVDQHRLVSQPDFVCQSTVAVNFNHLILLRNSGKQLSRRIFFFKNSNILFYLFCYRKKETKHCSS